MVKDCVRVLAEYVDTSMTRWYMMEDHSPLLTQLSALHLTHPSLQQLVSSLVHLSRPLQLQPPLLPPVRSRWQVPPLPGHLYLALLSHPGLLFPPHPVQLPGSALLAQSQAVLYVALHPGLHWLGGQLHCGGGQAHEMPAKED